MINAGINRPRRRSADRHGLLGWRSGWWTPEQLDEAQQHHQHAQPHGQHEGARQPRVGAAGWQAPGVRTPTHASLGFQGGEQSDALRVDVFHRLLVEVRKQTGPTWFRAKVSSASLAGRTGGVGVACHDGLPNSFFDEQSPHSKERTCCLRRPGAGLQSIVTGIMHLGWVLAWFALGSLLLSALAFPTWWRGRGARVGLASRGLLGRFRVWWLSALLLLLPAVLMWAWVGWRPQQADAFDDSALGVNAQVSELLRGEQLVPPPPPPPALFAAAEVEEIRPMLSSADRRWERMDVDFVQALLRVFKVMKEVHGYDMALLEGYRSPERQAVLLARGPNVTGAAPGQSYHQHGLAADCAFLRDGRLVISERDPWAMRGYELYGQVAEQHGLTWGGRWRLMDFGHVEWRKPGLRLPKATQLVTTHPS